MLQRNDFQETHQRTENLPYEQRIQTETCTQRNTESLHYNQTRQPKNETETTQQQNTVCGNLQPLSTTNYNHTQTTLPHPTRHRQLQGGFPRNRPYSATVEPKASGIIWFAPN